MLNQLEKQTIDNTKTGINKAPSTTGVYIYKQGNKITYIGKSINLKARLLSHLENAKMDQKEAAIISSSEKIEFVITDSEFKALILEAQLIQKYLPKYNVIWRDNKSYLYIKIAVKDDYPKITFSRRENDGHSKYFGPFPSVRTAEELLKHIRKIFPYCTQKNNRRPCFYSKIGLCSPCPGYIETTKDPIDKKALQKLYRYNINQIVKVFQGNTESVLKTLRKQIEELIKEERYEDAMVLRDKIFRFEHLITSRAFIAHPHINYNQSVQSIEMLKTLLQEEFPNLTDLERIECYDISNMSMREATASMVVYTSGLVDKKQYRRFKIKDLQLQSDFDMLEEILKRRFKRKDWPEPNLIVIDGGKPQVRVALKVASQMAITTPIIGIAKNPDRIVIGKRTLATYRPKINNLGFNLIRAIRDESHRFAKKYHLLLRGKKLLQ